MKIMLDFKGIFSVTQLSYFFPLDDEVDQTDSCVHIYKTKQNKKVS